MSPIASSASQASRPRSCSPGGNDTADSRATMFVASSPHHCTSLRRKRLDRGPVAVAPVRQRDTGRAPGELHDDRPIEHRVRQAADTGNRLRAPRHESARLVIFTDTTHDVGGIATLRTVHHAAQLIVIAEERIGFIEQQRRRVHFDGAKERRRRDPAADRERVMYQFPECFEQQRLPATLRRRSHVQERGNFEPVVNPRHDDPQCNRIGELRGDGYVAGDEAGNPGQQRRPVYRLPPRLRVIPFDGPALLAVATPYRSRPSPAQGRRLKPWLPSAPPSPAPNRPGSRGASWRAPPRARTERPDRS